MNWKNEFKNPPRAYGIYPMVHDSTRAFPFEVAAVAHQGWGGAVLNLQYTEAFPNDTAAWDTVEERVRKCINDGMSVWIYDEKGYPSGTAGGAVVEGNPEYESMGLLCLKYWLALCGPRKFRLDIPNGEPVSILLVPTDGGEPIDVTHTDNGSGTLRFDIPEGEFYIWMFVSRRLYDATHVVHSYSEPRRYVDLFNPNATKAFIDCTYQKYADRLQDELGHGIKAFFTDEPSLIAWNIPDASYPLLPWGYRFKEEFKARYGYDIGLALVAVCNEGGGDYIRRRCDYWDMVSDLLAQNFFRPISDWCREHNTVLSGHLLGEEHLSSHLYCYGSLYRSMKELGYPGIDILGTSPNYLMNTNVLPIARLAASFADLYDRELCMSEASDMQERWSGLRFPLEWGRASVNWHYAQGVNHINSYYVTTSFSDEEMREWNTYTARLGLALRQGKRLSRVAVLYPECSAWAEFRPTATARNGNQSEIMQRVERTLTDTSWALLKRQIDYDYIDEAELKAARLEDNILAVRNRRYECLILPFTHVLQQASFEKLVEFINAGGRVIAVDGMPEFTRETGLTAKEYARLMKFKAEGRLHFVSSSDFSPFRALLPATIRLEPDRSSMDFMQYGGLEITVKEAVSAQILSHVRQNGDETIIFLCNMGGGKYSGTLTLPPCSQLICMDPESGDTKELESLTTIPLELPPCAGMLYVLKK